MPGNEVVIKISALTQDARENVRQVRREFGELRNALRGVGIGLSAFAASGLLLGRSLIKTAMEAGAASRQFWRFEDAVWGLRVSLGEQLIQVLEPIVGLLTRVVEAFAAAPPWLQRVAVVGGLVATALAAIIGPAFLLVSAIPGFVAGIGLLSVAFGTLTVAMGPITLIVLGIAAAIAVGLLVWRNWETIIEGLRGALSVLDQALGGLLSSLGLLGSDMTESGKIAQFFSHLMRDLGFATGETGEAADRSIPLWEHFFRGLLGPIGLLLAALEKLRRLKEWLATVFEKTGGQTLSVEQEGDQPGVPTPPVALRPPPEIMAPPEDTLSRWQKIWDSIVSWFTETAWPAFRDFWANAWISVREFASSIWTEIKTKIGEIWDSIISWFMETAWPAFSEFWVNSWIFIREIVSSIWRMIKTKIGEIWDSIVSWFTETAWPTFSDFWATAWIGVKDTVVATWESVRQTVKDGINWVIDQINAFIQRVNSIRINIPRVQIPLGGTVGGGSVAFPQLPLLPRLAHGGQVIQPGMALVGERGPELVTLPRGAAVSPLGSGAGLTVIYNQNAPVYGFLDFEAQVIEVVRNAKLAGGFRGVF